MPEAFEKHIMIAANDTDSSRRAVMYVAGFLGGHTGFRVTLLSLIPVPQDDFFVSETEKSRWIEEMRAADAKLLGRLGEILIQGGMPEGAVDTRVVHRQCPSVADALINEALAIGACTIVVGRRGLSPKEELMFGSTSGRLVRDSKQCAVWIVQ